MTSRRLFLQTGLVSVFGLASQVSKGAPPTPPAISAMTPGYRFTNGTTALKRSDGAWIFWVRIINPGDPKSDISVTLQVATDRNFTQVIDAIPLTLSASKSFIAQPVYVPKTPNVQLYYRYIVAVSTSAPSVTSAVGSIAPWNTESKAE